MKPRTSLRAMRSVRTFRLSALALILPALPLAIGWTSGFYGTAPTGITTIALGAHRVVAWLLPPVTAAVLAYGTAGMVVDRRVAASGPRDIRDLWWQTQVVAVVVAFGASITVAAWLSQWSAEPVLALLVPGLVGTAVAVATAQIVVSRFGLGPSSALGLSVSAVGLVTVMPYFLPGAGLAVDATMRHWLGGGPERQPAVSVAAMVWLALTTLAVLLARRSPRDIARLSWIAKEVEG